MTDEERSVPTSATAESDAPAKSPRSTERRRRPWLAAVLSVLWPGLGQIYNGQVRKAMILAPAMIVVVVAGALLVLFTRSWIPLGLFLAIGGAIWAWGAVDAARAARNAPSYRLAWYNRVVVYVAYALALQLVYGLTTDHLKTRWVRAFRIPSGSMYPTLQTGDYFFADMRAESRPPAHGDLLVVGSPPRPDQQFVKRVIAVPGDRVEIREKTVLRNGSPLEEPYAIHVDPTIHPAATDTRDNLDPVEVPVRSIWVLGDNRDNSTDSRQWGPVPRDFVLGRPFLIYWSWDAELGRVRWERMGKRVR